MNDTLNAFAQDSVYDSSDFCYNLYVFYSLAITCYFDSDTFELSFISYYEVLLLYYILWHCVCLPICMSINRLSVILSLYA